MMPSIETCFGTLDYQEEARIEFPWGLPGFEDARWFVLVDQPESRPLVFLQSMEQRELCFMTLPVAEVAPDYRLRILPEDLERLGLDPSRQPEPWEVLALAIVCVEDKQVPSVNLLGPVVINRYTRKAVQAIRDDMNYSARQPLLAEGVTCS
jgi:flagellar assembly factor FliW